MRSCMDLEWELPGSQFHAGWPRRYRERFHTVTQEMTHVSRRQRRLQARSPLSRAVVDNAGTVGRGAAAAFAATGLLIASGTAANASPAESQGRDVTTVPVTQSDLSVERSNGGAGLAVTASRDLNLTFDRHGVSSDSGSEAESGHTLDQYLPGTRGLVEQLAEDQGVDPYDLFEELINDEDAVDADGVLDHAALETRVAGEAATEAEPTSLTLDAYLPGTRGLVEALAQIEGVDAYTMYDQLLADGTFVDENGVLDHAGLQARVSELTVESQPQQETQQQPQQTQPQQAEADAQAEAQAQAEREAAAQAEAQAQAEREAAEQAEQQETQQQEQTAQVTATAGQDQQESNSGSLGGVVSAAYSGVGTPYVWGGKGPGGWDCSGFVSWAFAQAGMGHISGNTSGIMASPHLSQTSNPQPGDIVVQNGGGHIAIYVGNGQMIGAQNSNTGTILYGAERTGNTTNYYLTAR